MFRTDDALVFDFLKSFYELWDVDISLAEKDFLAVISSTFDISCMSEKDLALELFNRLKYTRAWQEGLEKKIIAPLPFCPLALMLRKPSIEIIFRLPAQNTFGFAVIINSWRRT